MISQAPSAGPLRLSLENQQTEPDIRLMSEHSVVITGKDQQLDAAVAELMKLVQ